MFFLLLRKWQMANFSHYTLLKVKVPEKVKVPNPALVNISPILAMANG